MATQIDIYNGAAIHLGKDPVFTDLAKAAQQSATGQALHAAWPLVLEAALRAHFWGFARGRQLVAVAEYVPPAGSEWTTAYELPSDCVRAWDINFRPGVKREPFEREANYLLANTSGSILLRYIKKILTPASFDAEFTLYMANELAKFVALKVTGSGALAERLQASGEGILQLARTVDAQERDEQADDEQGDWVEYRGQFA